MEKQAKRRKPHGPVNRCIRSETGRGIPGPSWSDLADSLALCLPASCLTLYIPKASSCYGLGFTPHYISHPFIICHAVPFVFPIPNPVDSLIIFKDLAQLLSPAGSLLGNLRLSEVPFPVFPIILCVHPSRRPSPPSLMICVYFASPWDSGTPRAMSLSCCASITAPGTEPLPNEHSPHERLLLSPIPSSVSQVWVYKVWRSISKYEDYKIAQQHAIENLFSRNLQTVMR